MIIGPMLHLLRSGIGPDRLFAAAQQYDRNGGQTGRSSDETRTGAFDPERSSSQCEAKHRTLPGRHSSRTFDPGLPPTFSHLIRPAQRNILAPAGKIILG